VNVKELGICELCRQLIVLGRGHRLYVLRFDLFLGFAFAPLLQFLETVEYCGAQNESDSEGKLEDEEPDKRIAEVQLGRDTADQVSHAKHVVGAQQDQDLVEEFEPAL